MRARRWHIVTAFALIALVLFVLFGKQPRAIPPSLGDHSVVRTIPATQGVGVQSADSGSDDGLARSARTPREIDEDPTLQVVNPLGAPVPRAAILVERGPTEALVSSKSRGFLSWTDSEGKAVLRRAWIEEHETEVLWVSARGLQPGSIRASDLLDGSKRIQLEAGYTQTIRCIHVDGSAIEGAWIRLSKAPQEEFDEPSPEWSVPNPSSDIAIVEARTDSNGYAVFEGLAPGVHGIRTRLKGCALLSGDPSAGTVDVPHDRTVLTFADLVCVVGRFEGDVAINSRTVFLGGYELNNYAEHAVDRARSELKANYPDCLVAVAAQESVLAEPVLVRTLFDRAGIQEFHVSPVSIREFKAPQILQPPPTAFAQLEQASLIIVDPLGGNPAIAGLYVALDEEETIQTLTISIIPNGAVRLPRGSYAVKSRNPWVRRDLQASPFVVPGTNVAALKQTFRLCRIWVLEPDGSKCHRALLSIESGGLRLTHGYASTEAVEVWLPTGVCSLRATSPSDAVAISDVTVEESESYSTQDIVVRLAGN